ncbi:ammonium transporter [Clostridium grantii]|uniref:Ammonium transporter n=1 Tax=Clostridium grantii DSM 8605 TaxID=1121316 RepID=A0A1M5Y0C0_9CLOT|nr:ammonium transporter [Clostridium grantii]SHI04973.1 ammonium transporter [Clostridium grantii DSM 8605]
MDMNLVMNSMWVLIASILVFLMHAGFAMVEVGFTQSKNAVNIIMKNFVTVAIGVIGFFIVGYGIMYGESFFNIFGTSGFMLLNTPDTVSGISFEVFFFFQAIFAATCATIVSGAMAERTKFLAYIIFCVIATTLIYPLVGHWIWGGGFLSQMGFRDFAGGTAVHAVGGFAALMGAKLVGARDGKYKNGKIKAIPGHNIPLGALGVLILWFGWFGFNPGSTLDITSPLTAHAAITTLLGGSAATLSSMLFSTIRYKKPDAGLTLNGALAGLVGVTAGASMISYFGAIFIGIVAGIVMIFAVEYIDTKLKIDDPVGAISVHGVCGTLGTICIGLFATDGGLFYGGGFGLLGIQILGVCIVALTVLTLSYITFKLIDKFYGLRVESHEEARGLDAMEHGISAYIDL